ncbi:transposase [Actinoplanes rectilineatus]|uniref:transposase n=1 Tax=Actinoplanes rectilineatus TaxID=113571 RepID=UPI00247FB376|nr:transposase [Actinoplanes rectilineatus]
MQREELHDHLEGFTRFHCLHRGRSPHEIPVQRVKDRERNSPAFNGEVYRQRNVVERCFNRFKQWRALATRYAKRAAIYRASLLLIAALIWLR